MQSSKLWRGSALHSLVAFESLSAQVKSQWDTATGEFEDLEALWEMSCTIRNRVNVLLLAPGLSYEIVPLVEPSSVEKLLTLTLRLNCQSPSLQKVWVGAPSPVPIHSSTTVVFSWALFCVPFDSVFHEKNIASTVLNMNKVSNMNTHSSLTMCPVLYTFHPY